MSLGDMCWLLFVTSNCPVKLFLLYLATSACSAKNLAGFANANAEITANGYSLLRLHANSAGPISPTAKLVFASLLLKSSTNISEGLRKFPLSSTGMNCARFGLT